MITRELLEQKIAEYQAGKDKALAEANAFDGAIQALVSLVLLLDAPEEPAKEESGGES